MPDAFIAGTGTAVPAPVPTSRFLEVDARMRRRHGQPASVAAQVRSFAENSRIEMRHAVAPGWQPEDVRDKDAEDPFTDFDFDPPAWQRARVWRDNAPALAIRAARAALADSGFSAADVTHVVTTSTTGWSEPGVAASVIRALGLGEDTAKIELNFNGCFCGMSCLRTARDIVRGGEAGAVLVVGVEISSAQYNVVDQDISQLVANILFSDGAGAAVVAPSGKWRFERAGMSMIPGSERLLRWNPDFERDNTTYKMYLDATVAKELAAWFRSGRGRGLVDALLAEEGPPPALGVHPGGPNILEGIQGVFAERGWGDDPLANSFATLRQNGNLGAAAILFVLDRLLRTTDAARVATFAFGPGVTVEWGALRRA